jgi:hypothetical protein
MWAVENGDVHLVQIGLRYYCAIPLEKSLNLMIGESIVFHSIKGPSWNPAVPRHEGFPILLFAYSLSWA